MRALDEDFNLFKTLWRPGRAWVRSLEEGGYLMSFLATELFNFNFEGNCINERFYFVSNSKLIITGA